MSEPVNTFIYIAPDEDRYVACSDLEIPDARINFDGDHPAAECPSCDAKIRLQGYENPRPDGSSYTAHYLIEHLLSERVSPSVKRALDRLTDQYSDTLKELGKR